MDIKVVLVPFADLKIRAELAPAGDAPLGKLRLFAAAKPAVVDDFWDHGSVLHQRIDLPDLRAVRIISLCAVL